MFNSFGFNSGKFDSVLVIEQVSPTSTNVNVFRRPKHRRRLKSEDFKLVGKKLLKFNQILNIVGILLLLNDFEVPLNALKLYETKRYLSLLGKKVFSFEDIIDIKAFVKYLTEAEIEVVAFKKFATSEEQEIKAKKLIFDSCQEEIKGIKQLFSSQQEEIKGKISIKKEEDTLIVGKKDIMNVLEALDLLDGEEI